MFGRILNFWKSLGGRVKQYLKQWTKPVTAILVTGTLSDKAPSRVDLIAQNAMLRQQLIVLNRQVKRPRLTNADRTRLVIPARRTRSWQQALLIVQPDTVLRWHRDLFRRYWQCSVVHYSAASVAEQEAKDACTEWPPSFLRWCRLSNLTPSQLCFHNSITPATIRCWLG